MTIQNNKELNIMEHEKRVDIQLAENEYVDSYDSTDDNEYVKKRELLKMTKIVKQTWSIMEIYQKIKGTKLKLSPEYQRNEIWGVDKQTAFVESLFMDILVPPVYVVEIPGDDLLEDSTYEVVDGKQRLTAINKFLKSEYSLKAKSLEYFTDIFADKTYTQLQEEYQTEVSALLSSVLDIYVITANSPEFTKYDIFSRLNKGSEKLRVNEIRKAVYRSKTLQEIEGFVNLHLSDPTSSLYSDYLKVYSDNDIKRFEDYGRFYRSVAFYKQSVCSGSTAYVDNYNSRPRDMINNVLQRIQSNEIQIDGELLNKLLNFTLKFSIWLQSINIELNRINYIIDACVPFVEQMNDFEDIRELLDKPDFVETFVKSPATTTNVNSRLSQVKQLFL